MVEIRHCLAAPLWGLSSLASAGIEATKAQEREHTDHAFQSTRCVHTLVVVRSNRNRRGPPRNEPDWARDIIDLDPNRNSLGQPNP